MKQEHPDKQVEIWFQDEARIGQQGTLTTIWAETGSRPTAVKQTEYQWCYLFGAVNPLTGESSALVAPTVNTNVMNIHLRFISEEAGPNRHIVFVLDRAGWHVAKALDIPENVTLLYLPPYSPELNPIERLWAYLKQHYLSNRIFENEVHLYDQTNAAWNQLDEERLKTITNTEWIKHEVQT